jgi:dTDP-4-amino-4,6-dideoxygalactose transaminase
LRFLGYAPSSLRETERAARENFSLPLWAGITRDQQERVAETVLSVARVPAT